MGRIITSDLDCAECLCRVCARSVNNDSYNKVLAGWEYKKCNPCYFCDIDKELVETDADCRIYLPDEE